MDPPFSAARKKRHDAPELPQLKHPFNKQQMQMPLHPPRRSFSISTHANLASTFFPQYAPPSPLPLSSPLSSTPGSPITRSSFFTRRPSTSFQYMTSHGSSSTLSLSTSLGASSPYPSSPASATFFADLVSSLEGGDKFTIPVDMDAIDLESENEGMKGHIEELDEEEDGLEDLDEDVESTTDETGNDSDTDTDSDGGSSEVDLESEYDNIEDVDHTDGPTGLEDTKASTLSTSMTLGLLETHRQTAISRRSPISSELSVAWSNRIAGYADNEDVAPPSHTEQDTLGIEMTSPPVTAPIWSLPFETPLLETITTFEANIPEIEDHGHKSQVVQGENTTEEDSLENDVKLDQNEDKDKENTQNSTTDENDTIVLREQMEHNPEKVSIQAFEMTLEDESIPSPAPFIDSQEMEMDAMDDEQASFILTTNDTDQSPPNTLDQSTRPTSPYSVWSYLEDATKQDSGPTSKASAPPLTRTCPEQDSVPLSPSTGSKTVCSNSEASSGSDSETTPSSPVSPPPYVATLKQTMESKSAMTMPMKITATQPTTTRLVSHNLKSRMSSALRSGFSAASARASSSLTFFSTPNSTTLEGDGHNDLAQDEHQTTSGTLELEVLQLQAEITVLHARIDRLEMDRDEMTPSSNKRQDPGHGPVDRNKKSWTVRGVVVMVLKKGLIHAVLVIVVWVVCYKRQEGLRMASDGWQYLKWTKQRWITRRARH
ncbi:hypothetical protein BG005_002738 [Podila minutissima]|nr:hypothetical protein BG005_002738 [Podila minutissima]